MLLRLLCLIPASIGVYNNITKASSRAEFDDTGLFENKSTPLIHNVALVWVLIYFHHSFSFTHYHFFSSAFLQAIGVGF
jgi:hypothetical protein